MNFKPLTLLKQFLSDRIGINVQRKEEQKSSRYAKKLSMLSSLKIDDSIPQIKKSTVDERINNYRAEMALEAQKKQAIEGKTKFLYWCTAIRLSPFDS